MVVRINRQPIIILVLPACLPATGTFESTSPGFVAPHRSTSRVARFETEKSGRLTSRDQIELVPLPPQRPSEFLSQRRVARQRRKLPHDYGNSRQAPSALNAAQKQAKKPD